ncbi:hypothetical protein BRO54_3614 [Geobacillus proteiniphilus]|nr:hypothetical protein BRO54_3614 [Geobacillus proteiniphilus]
MMLTIQQAAAKILQEMKIPLSAKELAKIALEKGLVQSQAKDAVQSLSQTLERNVRMNVGNNPELQFVYLEKGRCLALPEWKYEHPEDQAEYKEKEQPAKNKVTIDLPVDLLNQIRIYQLGNELNSFNEAIVHLIKKGISASTNELLEKLKSKLNNL